MLTQHSHKLRPPGSVLPSCPHLRLPYPVVCAQALKRGIEQDAYVHGRTPPCQALLELLDGYMGRQQAGGGAGAHGGGGDDSGGGGGGFGELGPHQGPLVQVGGGS